MGHLWAFPRSVVEWTNWRLLFASQPEPDLEFTEEDFGRGGPPPPPPMNAPKGRRKDRCCGSCSLPLSAALATWPWIPTQRCNRFNRISTEGGDNPAGRPTSQAPPYPSRPPHRRRRPPQLHLRPRHQPYPTCRR